MLISQAGRSGFALGQRMRLSAGIAAASTTICPRSDMKIVRSQPFVMAAWLLRSQPDGRAGDAEEAPCLSQRSRFGDATPS
jgi:hypothetical protein